MLMFAFIVSLRVRTLEKLRLEDALLLLCLCVPLKKFENRKELDLDLDLWLITYKIM